MIVDGSAIQNQIELLGGKLKRSKKANDAFKYAVFDCDCNLGKLYAFFEEWGIDYTAAKENKGRFIVKFKDMSSSKPYTVTDANGVKRVIFSKDEQTAAKFVMNTSKAVKTYLVKFADAAYTVKAKDEKEAAELAYNQYRKLRIADGTAVSTANNIESIVKMITTSCQKLESSEPESQTAKSCVDDIERSVKEIKAQLDSLVKYIEHWI